MAPGMGYTVARMMIDVIAPSRRDLFVWGEGECHSSGMNELVTLETCEGLYAFL